MTNEEIILRESLELMKQGVLKCAGQVTTVDENGNEGKMDYPEAIHTYKEWIELGYKVKKGEHAVAKFAIWKPARQKKNDDDDEQSKERRFFLANASWFTFDQVERYERKGVI